MKTLTFPKPDHRLTQLHEELLTAAPSAFVATNPDGVQVATAVVESDGDEIRLTVPDEADEVAIMAVVEAHVPQAPTPPPDPFADLGAALAAIDVTAETPAVQKMHAAVLAFVAAAQSTGSPS